MKAGKGRRRGRASNFAVTVEDRSLLSLAGLNDLLFGSGVLGCFGRRPRASIEDAGGYNMGLLLQAKSSSISSVARLLYTISDVLPQTASAGMVLYKSEIKKLTEVVFTNFSKMPRETFFTCAREALPLNKAIKTRAYDMRLYAEPIFSPTSEVLGVLVCQSDQNSGYTAVDRQFLQTANMTIAAFMKESTHMMKQGGDMASTSSRLMSNSSQRVGSRQMSHNSPRGDSFLDSFVDKTNISSSSLDGGSSSISVSDSVRREPSVGGLGGSRMKPAGNPASMGVSMRSSQPLLPGGHQRRSGSEPGSSGGAGSPLDRLGAGEGEGGREESRSLLDELNERLQKKFPECPEVSTSMNTWIVDEELLVDILVAMFDVAGALKPLKIPNRMMRTILMDIREHYLESYFHNFEHAFTVTLVAFSMLSSCRGLRRAMQEPIVRFSLLMATVCHDINHPGNNNEFEVKSQSRLAILYNDTSVLENYHCTVTFEVLIEHGLDELFAEQDAGEALWEEFRQIVVQAILATDMQKHKQLQKRLLEAIRDPGLFSPADWVTYVLHTADLGNLTLDWEVALEWENRIFKEFKSQARREQELGLDVAPYMLKMSLAARGRVQAGFIDFVLCPWWESMAQLLPELQDRVDTLHLSRKKYAIYLKENDRRASVDGAGDTPRRKFSSGDTSGGRGSPRLLPLHRPGVPPKCPSK